MIFQVVSPFVATIDGDSFKDAIKNFIKLNHNINITQMIIKDQSNQMRANIKYYQQDGRNKVGINMFPVGLDYPVPIVVNDTFIPNTIVETPLIPVINADPLATLFPLSPIPLSPYNYSTFIPTVINIPTNL